MVAVQLGLRLQVPWYEEVANGASPRLTMLVHIRRVETRLWSQLEDQLSDRLREYLRVIASNRTNLVLAVSRQLATQMTVVESVK